MEILPELVVMRVQYRHRGQFVANYASPVHFGVGDATALNTSQ